MTDNLAQRITADAAETLQRSLKRLRQQLREAECQAPPPIFQMLEELRLTIAEDSDKARHKLREKLHSLGASEEEFLEWLQLDVRLLEQKLIKALSLAADPSKVDLAAWRKAEP